jgi:hypothetical protein
MEWRLTHGEGGSTPDARPIFYKGRIVCTLGRALCQAQSISPGGAYEPGREGRGLAVCPCRGALRVASRLTAVEG